MDRKLLLHQMARTVALISLLGLFTGVTRAEPSGNRPSVLFIMSDDLRPDLGCYGDTTAKTPNLDKLAATGTVFGRAYCQLAVCNPSRVSILSGCRPDTTRIYDNYNYLRPNMPNAITLPQLFKRNGYQALSIGKIYHHSASNPGNDPLSWSEPMYGFAKPYRHWYSQESMKVIAELRRRGKRPRGPAYEMADKPDSAYPDGRTAGVAIESLRRVKDKSFFLAVGFVKPHLPFTCPKKYWDMYPQNSIKIPDNYYRPKDVPEAAVHNWYELRSYAGIPSEGEVTEEQAINLIRGYRACVSFLDVQVGRVIDELDRLGLRENTIIVFVGDHGYHLGENRLWTKMTNFEIATRCPLIICAPGQKAAGKRSDALVEFVDIYPTLAQLANLELPEGLEGLSMAPLLDRPELAWKRAAFSQYGRGTGSRYKPEKGDPMGKSIRTDRYRYTEWRSPNGKLVGRELYDQKNDPENNTNMADWPEYKMLVRKLANQLRAGWQAALP